MFLELILGFFEIPRFFKRAIAIFIDCLFIVVAVLCALSVRDDLEFWLSQKLYYSIAITALITIAIWIKLGLYRAIIRFIDTKALSTLFIGTVLSGIIMIVVSYFLKTPMPRSIPFIYTTFLLILVGGSRLVVRGLINAQTGKSKTPVVIYGAGSSGRQLALALQHGAEFNPVAMIDDNLDLKNTNVAGLKVYSREHLQTLIDKYNVKKILLAIPSSGAAARKRLLNKLEKYSVEVLTIPGSADLVSGKLKVDILRKVDIVDLLGRDMVKPIDGLFRRCIENKNVMVTGAGGSIGSELCRQIVNQQPTSLILFEISEYALYAIENELRAKFNDPSKITIIPMLGSVLDRPLIEKTIRNFKVNTIYHAAAYKHVPIVEHNVVSGLRNNVWGTRVCAETALKCGVENFVLISTDKAVRPTNIMGTSKRLAELVLQALAVNSDITRFSMVRFGNVLGSSGSVVPLFRKQIANGGPLTITHPDITRYFMTIPEAAQLVIQAGAMGNGGEVYVLDMGKPVKINYLAEKMVHLSGLTIRNESNIHGDIEIVYTGLRPGEKLYEELLIGEDVEGTKHKQIMKARERSISKEELYTLLEQVDSLMENNDIEKIRKILVTAPLDYSPNSEIADSLWQQDTIKNGSSVSQEHLRVVVP